MISLLKKELHANYKYLFFGLVFFVLYAFIFAGNGPGVFMLCLVMLFYFLSATNLMLDERYKIDLLLGTFPIRRKTIVASKYVLVALVFLGSVVIYTALSFAARAAGYEKIPVLDLESAMLGLIAVSLFNAVMLPLCYRFGAQTTRYVSFVLIFLLFVLISLLGRLDLEKYLSFFANLRPSLRSLMLFGAALAVNAVSYSIACPLYVRKDF